MMHMHHSLFYIWQQEDNRCFISIGMKCRMVDAESNECSIQDTVEAGQVQVLLPPPSFFTVRHDEPASPMRLPVFVRISGLSRGHI